MGGFDGAQTYILLANTGSQPATVTLSFLLVDGPPLVKTFTVPPTSRFNVGVSGPGSAVPELADASFGVRIDSTQPIVVERSVYWNAGGWCGRPAQMRPPRVCRERPRQRRRSLRPDETDVVDRAGTRAGPGDEADRQHAVGVGGDDLGWNRVGDVGEPIRLAAVESDGRHRPIVDEDLEPAVALVGEIGDQQLQRPCRRPALQIVAEQAGGVAEGTAVREPVVEPSLRTPWSISLCCSPGTTQSSVRASSRSRERSRRAARTTTPS